MLKNIYKISIPIPMPALKVVNSYLLVENEELLMIDTGMSIRSSLAYLEEQLSQKGFKFKDIKRIIITHLHIDHIGGAGYIQRISNAPVSMHEKEVYFINKLIKYPEESIGDFKRIMNKSGVMKEVVGKMMFFHPGVSNQAVYSQINYNATVRDDDIIRLGNRKLRIIGTPGHSINHICIYDIENKILFSGDHVLPKITPNIRVPINEDDPLGEYLDSLEKVERLEVKYYFPGHGEIKSDLKRRIGELRFHHYKRLLETLEIISEKPLNAYEIASRMNWDIDMPWEDFPTIQKYFAIGETLAHIRYLQYNNIIINVFEEGIEKFRLSPTKKAFEDMLKEKVCKER